METVIFQIPNSKDRDMLLHLAQRLDCKVLSFNTIQNAMDNTDRNIDILDKSISFSGLQLEFAVFLYERKIFSLEQASNFAEIDIAEFQYILGSRKIPIHYDIEDFEKDMLTLDTLRLNENSK